MYFENTEAFELAKAVSDEDLDRIQELVQKQPNLLEYSEPQFGVNVLIQSILSEKYKSFTKLLELGANPNYISPITKETPLITSTFLSTFNGEPDLRFMRALLQHGADPNYTIEEDFTDVNGNYHFATTAFESSIDNLEKVKLLVQYGADPSKLIRGCHCTAFGSAVMRQQFDVINYFIDTLKVNVHQPMYVRENDTIYIQDLVKRYMSYKPNTSAYMEAQKLREKLQRMGIDFENHNYKL